MRILFAAGLANALLSTVALAQSSSLPQFPGQGTVELGAGQGAPVELETMLNTIYKSQGKGEAFELPDGRFASVWLGQSFALEGKPYFVGLTTTSSSKEPSAVDELDVGAASYAGDSKTPLATNQQVGKTYAGGAGGNAPEPDSDRKTVAAAPTATRAVFARPTLYSAQMGTLIQAYEIFAFDAASGAVTYAGSINSGSDNGAGCGGETKISCITNSGQLELLPANPMSWGEWPVIRVTMTGDILGDDGAVRPAGPNDILTYKFDTASGQYAEVKGAQ